MKKIAVILSMALGLLITTTTNAQNKIGYISIDQVVGLMPINTDSMNAFVQKYLVDSVQPQIEYLQSEYNRKYAQLVDTTTKDAVRKTILAEVQDLEQQLQNVEGAVQQIRQSKQQEYLDPYYTKAVEALREVSKANGYGYVFTKDALLVAPPGDDLLPLVAKKLNLKLPEEKPAAKPAAGGTKPAAKN